MANVRITELPDLPEATDLVVIPADNGIQTYKLTLAQLKEFIGASAGVPIGTVVSWPSDSSLPIGYLDCDHSERSETTFSQLFGVLGTRFNNGSEAPGNFRLPPYNGIFLRGAGSQMVNGRLKDGGLVGDMLEDQMQKITGDFCPRGFSNTSGPHPNSPANGAFSRNGTPSSNRRLEHSGTSFNSLMGGFAFDSGDSPNARTSTTTDGETRPTSSTVRFIIRAENLETSTATTSAIDSLNNRVSITEQKQEAQKLIQIVATQRSFKTTASSSEIVASDAPGKPLNSWVIRELNYSSQTIGSIDYFEHNLSSFFINIKKPGRYLVSYDTQHRRANFGQSMVQYFPPTGISLYNQKRTRTSTTLATPGSEQSVSNSYILEIEPGREGGNLFFSQWAETNTSDERYGTFFCRGSDDSPYNYVDTCNLRLTLIEDL